MRISNRSSNTPPTHTIPLPCTQLSAGTSSPDRVAYQGVAGAYSEMAARKACPTCEPLPCDQFEVAFQVGCMGRPGQRQG